MIIKKGQQECGMIIKKNYTFSPIKGRFLSYPKCLGNLWQRIYQE